MILKFIRFYNMKNIAKISLIFFITFIVACGGEDKSNEEQETATTEVSADNLIAADYKIDGMVCAMGCAKTIEDEIGDIEGVSVSSVDFESGKAHFEFDESKVSEDAIVSKINSLADGQYKAGEWVEESEEEEEVEASEVEDQVEVSFSSIEIPNLFTYLIKNL